MNNEDNLFKIESEKLSKFILLVKNIAKTNGLFFNINELDENIIINNILNAIGIYDDETFLNMTNNQKGTIPFYLGMLESRKFFFADEKRTNTIDVLQKTSDGQKIHFNDFNEVKEIIRNHPDLDMAGKINMLKKLKTIPPVHADEAFIYLTDSDYYDNKRNEFKSLGEKYFIQLGGVRKIDDQVLLYTGDFINTMGIGNIQSGICRGYFMYKKISFTLTDEVINTLIMDKNFIKEFQNLKSPKIINITDEFIKEKSYGRTKLKNVLLSLKDKQFNTKEDFEKILNNLMPTIAKSDEDDKNYLQMLLDKDFLDNLFKVIKNIDFPTPESFEIALTDVVPAMNDSIKSKIKEYTITSFNNMAIDVTPEEDEIFGTEDLQINISGYGDVKHVKINITLVNLNLKFDVNKDEIELEKLMIDGDYIKSNKMYIELEDLGVLIFDKMPGVNITINKEKFAYETVYINIINSSKHQSQLHITSNYSININTNTVIMTKYEQNKFIMNDKELNIFIKEHKIDIGRLLFLFKKPDMLNGFLLINSDDNKNVALEQYTELSFDKRYTKRITITSYNKQSVTQNINYNIPPIPPYLAVQLKTEPTLMYLAQLSQGNNNNLRILRSLSLFKIMIDNYMKTSTPQERNALIKKDITINLNNKVEIIKLFKLFDIFNKIKYLNQLK